MARFSSDDGSFLYAVFKQASLRTSRRGVTRHDMYLCERALVVDDVVELTGARYVVADVWLPDGGRRGSAFVKPVEH
ncbi:MAG TPA: hypothetical protein VH572_10685 [Gaiella sp.]|jgi:hypothetical protein